MDSKSIEAFFLNTLLKLATAGIVVITVVDVFFYPLDHMSIIIDLVILIACVLAYGLRLRAPVSAMLIFTSVLLVSMIYQCIFVPMNTSISLCVLLLDGFIVSVMLKHVVKIVMHTLIVTSVTAIFIYQYMTPSLSFAADANEMVSIAVTYLIIYFNLAYPSSILKAKYDRINRDLNQTNDALTQQTREMTDQNAALLSAQNQLAMLNTNLERILNERTARIQAQNEILVRYSYNNAHHLRGPVARLLGLAMIYKMDDALDADFIISKMVDQAHEIDTVVKLINEDLEANNLGIK